MKKRITAFLMVCMILSSNCNVIYAKQVTENIMLEIVENGSLKVSSLFSGKGDGTKTHPYQIRNAQQLDEIRNDLSAHYELKNDIDLSSISNWIPIGDKNNPFTGSFDGNDYTVTNLKIVSSESDYVGLFGYCSDSHIDNLNLSEVSIHVDKASIDFSTDWVNAKPLYVGAIAAYADGITNCSVKGTISVVNCLDAYVGGIVARGADINQCNNHMDIYVLSNRDGRSSNCGHVYCGGIVGATSYIRGDIFECENNGTIEAVAGKILCCGGISGEYGLIRRCVNNGDVKGNITDSTGYLSFAGNCNAGGIVGANSTDISYSVNYGNVHGYALLGSTCYVGGIAGYSGYYGDGKIIKCINLCDSVSSVRQLKRDGVYVDVFGTAGRIAGGIGTYASNAIQNSYSLDTTRVNQEIPVENMKASELNGASLDANKAKDMIKKYNDQSKEKVDISKCKIILKEESYTYTGKPVRPQPIIKYHAAQLKSGSDYTLSYTDNKRVGNATVYVKGKGNFTGKQSVAFVIISKDQEKADKKKEEITGQYNRAEEKMIKNSKKLFSELEEKNKGAKESIYKKISKKQLPRPYSITGKIMPKKAYETFLNLYADKINSDIEKNFSSYKNVKTTADLVNKISSELVSQDGKITFSSNGDTYTCEYKKLGGWGVLWTPMKIVNERSHVTYLWQEVQISEADIQEEMDYMEQYAKLKIDDARKACITDSMDVLQIGQLKPFLKKMTSKKSIEVIESTSPELASYAKTLYQAADKFNILKTSFSKIINFNLNGTNYDELDKKIKYFNETFEKWQNLVSEL